VSMGPSSRFNASLADAIVSKTSAGTLSLGLFHVAEESAAGSVLSVVTQRSQKPQSRWILL
jgi:hypothetical protein